MRFVFVLCSIFILIMPTAHATSNNKGKEKPIMNARQADNWERSLKTHTKKYDDDVYLLFKERNGVTNLIYGIRSRYPQTEYYNPFSKSLVDKIAEYAFIVDTSQDKIESNQALFEYNNFLKQHIADLGVVSYALELSQLDVRFGDEFFLKEVRDALINGIRSYPGMLDGSSAEKALTIITYSEENEILAQMGGVIKKSELFDIKGKKYYNVHDVETEDGESTRLFIDVTSPIVMVYKTQFVREKEGISSRPSR